MHESQAQEELEQRLAAEAAAEDLAAGSEVESDTSSQGPEDLAAGSEAESDTSSKAPKDLGDDITEKLIHDETVDTGMGKEEL